MATIVVLYNAAIPADQVTFPVTPTFQDARPTEKLEWRVSGRGRISRPFGIGERAVAFSAMLPGFHDRDQRFVQRDPATGATGWRNPGEIVNQLRYWQGNDKTPGIKLQLSVTGDRKLSMPCWLAKVDVKADGFGGQTTVDVELVEWKSFLVRMDGEGDPQDPPQDPNAPHDPDGDPSTDPVDPPAESAQYTVQPGDSLYQIAASALGDGARWQEIYQLNQSTIGGNPDVIQPGMVLNLPVDNQGNVDASNDAPAMDAPQMTPEDLAA